MRHDLCLYTKGLFYISNINGHPHMWANSHTLVMCCHSSPAADFSVFTDVRSPMYCVTTHLAVLLCFALLYSCKFFVDTWMYCFVCWPSSVLWKKKSLWNFMLNRCIYTPLMKLNRRALILSSYFIIVVHTILVSPCFYLVLLAPPSYLSSSFEAQNKSFNVI